MAKFAEYEQHYRWLVRLYWDGRHADRAQSDLEEGVKDVVDAFQQDPCIGGTCLWGVVQGYENFWSPGEKSFIMTEMEVITVRVESSAVSNKIALIRDGIKDILEGTYLFIKVNEYNVKGLPRRPAADIWFDGCRLEQHFGGNM